MCASIQKTIQSLSPFSMGWFMIFIKLWETWKGRINKPWISSFDFCFPIFIYGRLSPRPRSWAFYWNMGSCKADSRDRIYSNKACGEGFTVNKDQLHHDVVTTRCEADLINFVKSIERECKLYKNCRAYMRNGQYFHLVPWFLTTLFF